MSTTPKISVTIDGLEGAGQTQLALAIVRHLQEAGYKVIRAVDERRGVSNRPATNCDAEIFIRQHPTDAALRDAQRLQQTTAFALRNDQGYWCGIWNDRATAEQIKAKGQPSHSERIVELRVISEEPRP